MSKKEEKFYCKVGQATINILYTIGLLVAIEVPIIYQIMN